MLNCRSGTLNSTLLDCFSRSKSKSKLYYDPQSVGQSVLEWSIHLGLTTRCLLLSDSCGFICMGRSLWREDGSVVYICCWPSPTQSLSGPILWDSWSYFTVSTDGQSISKSWCRAPSAAHDQIFITLWQLRSCFCGAPSLTRECVCLLYMLLVLASVVFPGSESVWTRDHNLLSQICYYQTVIKIGS
jgi:hypothetical protein